MEQITLTLPPGTLIRLTMLAEQYERTSAEALLAEIATLMAAEIKNHLAVLRFLPKPTEARH